MWHITYEILKLSLLKPWHAVRLVPSLDLLVKVYSA